MGVTERRKGRKGGIGEGREGKREGGREGGRNNRLGKKKGGRRWYQYYYSLRLTMHTGEGFIVIILIEN